MRPLFFLFCLLCFVSIQAQSYSGYVFDEITKDTIIGASVYFDGTSIGTTTDENGFFQIESKEKINTPLLVSYVGYTTFKVDDSALGGITHIYLKEDQLNLNEVVVFDDTWSRERKMKHFKKEFLGQGKGGRKSRIKNEYAIKLRFNRSDSTLVAFSNEPILVENKYLGYLISFRIKEVRI